MPGGEVRDGERRPAGDHDGDRAADRPDGRGQRDPDGQPHGRLGQQASDDARAPAESVQSPAIEREQAGRRRGGRGREQQHRREVEQAGERDRQHGEHAADAGAGDQRAPARLRGELWSQRAAGAEAAGRNVDQQVERQERRQLGEGAGREQARRDEREHEVPDAGAKLAAGDGELLAGQAADRSGGLAPRADGM